MKLQSYQLCRWCDAAIHGPRKWLWLAGNVLALLLSLLFGVMGLMLPLLLAANAVLALYLLHRHHAFGAVYQRKPRPADALCETVLIDAALIGQGTRLRAAAQPIDVADSLSMRLGSGALLLGAAMTLTADTLSPADRAALLSAVHTLNIKPSRMRSHSPVLRREDQNGVTVVTVRDGMSERRYYLGAPADVAAFCPSIWEGHTRPMTAQDPARIADTAHYIAQGNCRVFAWATALENEDPIFLGMAGLGENVHLSALQDVAALRAMGLTVMLSADGDADTDLDSLHTLLELPDHHARADLHLTSGNPAGETALCITRLPGDSLVEPVTLLRQRFRIIEDTLRQFGQMLAFSLLIALLSGSASWLPILLTGLLLYAAIAIGVDLTVSRLGWPTMLAGCSLALLARGFLSAQPEPLTVMASGVIAVSSSFCVALRLCGKGFRLKGEGRKHGLILSGAALLLLAALLILGLFEGLRALLPLGFGLLISAVICLLAMREHHFLR